MKSRCALFYHFIPVYLATTTTFLLSPCLAFAAAKKNKITKNKATASTRKGFGVQGPTFAQVVAGFETRLPADPHTTPCPCGGGGKIGVDKDSNGVVVYANCCQPYHAGTKVAETPLRVLQSCYSAFCFRIIPYVMLTTHPTCQYWRKDTVKWAQQLDRDGTMDTFDFLGLTIMEKHSTFSNDDDGDNNTKESDIAPSVSNQAHVDFRVRVRNKKDGEETILKEKSLFIKQGDGWFYASGEARPEPVMKKQANADDSSSLP